ncbi:MAG: hypothetical protein QNJ45_25990 [Ardenticatenaceae bacterium]|nr:hypothetical protein [Ardenticatenaceae bacterium]
MTEQSQPETVNLVLASDELRLVLGLLQTATLPGLDPEATDLQTSEARRIADLVASRTLRARGLARLDDDGALSLHPTLLTAVGVCAYASSSLFVFHWEEQGTIPRRYFGHIREDDVVLHARPEADLHLFSLLPSRSALYQQLMQACEFKLDQAEGSMNFELPSPVFVQVRELAYASATEDATKLLVDHNVDLQAAEKFVHTLSSPHQVAIMQTLQQVGDEEVNRHDLTLLQNSSDPWLIRPQAQSDEGLLLEVRMTNSSEVEGFIASHL